MILIHLIYGENKLFLTNKVLWHARATQVWVAQTGQWCRVYWGASNLLD